MKFLLVSFSFAPLNIVSAQRINSWTRYLVSQGHSVDVLTSVKAPIDGPIDDIHTYESLRSVAKVHEVPFLYRRCREYADPNAVPASIAERNPIRRERLKRLKSFGTFVLGSLFDYRLIWAFAAYRYYARQLRQSHYEVLLTSSGPACVNLLGYLIKRLDGRVFWITDFRDLWSLNHLSAASAPTKRLERRIERFLLTDVDLITTVSENLSHQMHTLHNHKQVRVVRNGFDAAEMSAVVPNHAFFEGVGVADRTNIVYAGSIHSGRRDPSALIQEVIAAGYRDSVTIHFFGFNLGNVGSIVHRLNAQDFCLIHGSRPRAEILNIEAAADINLFLESGEQDAIGVLTGKLFELAAIARPILSIGPTDEFESITILKKTGLLIHWEVEIQSGLENIFLRSKTIRPAKEYISRLARNYQFNDLLEFIGANLDETSEGFGETEAK